MSHAVHRTVRPAVPQRAKALGREGLVEPSYQGLVTRAIAFALDAAIVNLVAIVVAAGVGLALSVLHLPDALDPALISISGLAFVLWSLGYFVIFWSSTGETPGDRVMRIRVCLADSGRPPSPLRALVRLGALILAVLPLFAGLLPIVLDDRRRGLHDMVAGTVVVAVPEG